MSAWLVLTACALAAVSGMPGLLLPRTSAWGERVAVGLLALAAFVGSGACVAVLLTGEPAVIARTWGVPGGALFIRVDAIAAMFLLQIFVIGLCSAVYGLGYWPQRLHPDNGRKLRLFFGLMQAGMALLVVANNSVLFLAGWEVMAFSCFLALTTEDHDPSVRSVGYLYFTATRLGTLCLFALFAALHAVSGTYELSLGSLESARALSPGVATAIFCLALAGFGLKAGIMPLHVWLPGAHANAPSHVSAVMSGVMIKMGIYGLVRITGLFTTPPLWWGAVLLALGIVSGVIGVAFAIGQHDIKRLLAYHSVENIGIICIGLGVALLGRTLGRPELVVLGLGGALLHVWNHGLFKALLFLAAGAVIHTTHTREIDRLGGLLRRMPGTGVLFVIGAVAICGLPPLNGFISELLIYLGLFGAAAQANGDLGVTLDALAVATSSAAHATFLFAAFAAAALAFIGGLALACFVKVFGAVFLGEERSTHAASGHDPGPSMLAPMIVLAAACAFIGLASPLVAPVLDAAVAAWSPAWSPGWNPSREVTALPLISSRAPLSTISVLGLCLIALVGTGWVFLRHRVRAARVGAQDVPPRAAAAVGTWDCGYAAPSARMQYTSSSFAQMFVGLFRMALRPDEHRPVVNGLFPRASSLRTHVPEVVLDKLVVPLFVAVGRVFVWMRWMQRGSVNAYLLYVLGTLIFVLLWRSRP